MGLKIAYPVCGRETDSSDLKHSDYNDNGPGYYECYKCDCSTSFSVEALVDEDAAR